MTTEPHTVERRFLATCGLQDDEQLRRIGVVLIAQTIVDRHLISVLVEHEAGKVGGAGVMDIDALTHLSEEICALTFAQHLQRARGLIPARAAEIAGEIERARTTFVHFKRNRFELPHYNGNPVAETTGFRACMDAVQEFLTLVPFRDAAWTANR